MCASRFWFCYPAWTFDSESYKDQLFIHKLICAVPFANMQPNTSYSQLILSKDSLLTLSPECLTNMFDLTFINSRSEL